MLKYFIYPLYLDLRSLALSRICIGLCLLFNLFTSLDSLTAFFTDQGVMPRGSLYLKYGSTSHFSLNIASGSYSYQLGLFLLAIIIAGLFMLGAYTRITAFLSWLFFLSIYNRNPLILDGGDDVLKLILFWFCFLPVSSFFSLDSKPTQSNRISNVASSAFIIQLASIYFFSALLKTSSHWQEDGTAIYLALALDSFSSEAGNYLLKFPELLKILTHCTLYAEKYFLFLLLIPFKNNLFRTFLVLTFLSFHLGLIIFMDLGLFPVTMLSAWLALIPSYFWEIKLFKNIKFKSALTYSTNFSLKPSFGQNILSKLVCLLLITYVLLWNIRSLNFNKYEPYFSRDLNWIGKSIRLDQYWALFAPKPTQDGGWYMITARTKKDLKLIDIKTGKKPDYSRPERTATTYKDNKWKKYLSNIWLKKYSKFRKFYANYLCNNSKEELSFIQISYMLEKTIDPNSKNTKVKKLRKKPKRVALWKQSCL